MLYLSRQMLLRDEQAFSVYGSIIALGFVTPVLGGFLADRWLGGKRSLWVGSLISAVGIFLLLGASPVCLYAGLALLMMGSGFIKAVTPSLLGRMTEATLGERDSAFALLYLYFNLGTFLGTVACAAVGEIYGWKYSFLIAGAVMVVCGILSLSGLDASQMTAGRSNLDSRAASEYEVGAARKFLKLVITLLCLMVFHAVFFALYEQGSLSLNLFAERNVDRSIAAFIPGVKGQLPVMAFQAIDPILNILLGSVFVYGWNLLDRRRVKLDYFTKFGVGLLFISAGFRVLALPQVGDALISPWYLTTTYLLFVLAEQFVVPTGFSAVSTLAPRRHQSLFMGLWFLSIGASVWVAGLLSKLTAGAGSEGIDPNESLRIYQGAFTFFSATPALLGLALVLVPLALRLRRRTLRGPSTSSEAMKNDLPSA